MTPLTENVEEGVPAWAVRLEAKLDVALAQHSAQIERNASAIVEVRDRVRRMEDDPKVDPGAMLDHETRLRAIEGTNYVTGKNLAAALLTTLSIAVAILAIFDRLSPV